MSPGTLPRYKRRKVLAIRRFPLGCGTNAVRLNPKPVEQTSCPAGLENGRVAIRHFPRGCGPNAVKLEDPKLREETSSPAGLKNGKVSIVEELCVLCSEAAVSPEIAELQNCSMPVPLENNVGAFSVVEEQCALCSEGSLSPEREELSNSLMPVALENNVGASNVVKEVCILCSLGSLSPEEEELPNSLIPAALENNVVARPENTKLEVWELVKQSSEAPKSQNGYSYLKIYGPPKWRKVSAIRQFPHGCGSNAECINKNGHQKPALQQQEKRDCSALVASTTNILHVVENMPLVKQPIVIDGFAGIAITENILNHANSMVNKATITDGLVKVVSVENIANYNRRESNVTEGKEISIDRNILVRSNSDKNFGVEGTIGHVQIKTSVMSGSDGTLKHSSSDKILQQQEKEEGSALVASTRDILHAMENMPLVKQPILIDEPAGIADIENTLKHEKSIVNQATPTDGFVIEKFVVYNRKDTKVTKGKEKNSDRNILVKSNSDKNFGVEGTGGHVQINSSVNNGSDGSSIRSSSDKTLQQQEKEEGCELVVFTENILHVVENMPFVKQPIVIDGSAGITDTESTHENSMVNQATTTDGLVNVAYVEKVAVYNRKDSRVTKGKEKSIDRNILVRSNTDKNLSVEGTSGHLQIKSSVKSGPDGTSKRSSSEKTLEGCKVDKAVENLQIKAYASSSLHLVVQSQIGSKPVNKEVSPLVEKPAVKENEISKKRKLPAEIRYNESVPYVNDGALVASGERMIIQALMAHENCPWRNSKRHGATTSKMMKERRLLHKDFASNKLSSSQQKNKGFIEDDDYLVEEKNRKFLTLCQKPNELSITMTPFVPPKLSQKGSDDGEVVARHKVKRALRLFQLICRKLLQGEESNSKMLGKVLRIDLQASGILKENGEWVNSGEPIIGHVPGVEIGDEFHYRVELSMVGLHRPYQGGIDCTKKNGLLVATSIVASDGYQDGMDSSDVLIYSGSGGTSSGADKQPVDQKLERGNLALRNSIDAHMPVRVIHGFKEKGSDPHDAKGRLVSSFTYDGLYHVEKYWQERGPHGFNVFKFQLRRKAGQPELALKELKRSARLNIREGLCVKDISKGMEKIPLSVVNTIDTDQPMPFKYITKNIYPSWYVKTPPRGCDCTNGCSDSEKCACAVKNGGEIPYNFNGAIVQAKPLIYECGPSCKCRPSCHNRVSQHGIRMQLEIFKTRGRGWGLRSLKSIPSGSFICEYIGELLQDSEAEQRANDEYLFDIGHNYDDHTLWEGLSNHIPELQSSFGCDAIESVGYTIDAAEYGNIGRFINHSCSPNLYAQNVLYDHDDKRMPHIMLFAVDNIPPLQELTYHYNYTIDQVHDSEGNIKQKACYCGSPECCGRLY